MQIEETIRRLLWIRDEHRQAKLNKQTNKQAVSRLFGTSDRHPAQGWCSQLLMIILFDDPMNCR